MSRLNSKQRHAILEGAVAVFAETGFAGATIRIVGRKAGVNSALIYYYFENKQNLFEEAIRMVIKDFLFSLDRRQKSFSGARDRVSFLVNGVFDYYEKQGDRMRLMMMVFHLHTQMFTRVILEFVRSKTVLPLAVLQEGIHRKELKPFFPIQLWWNILGMCMFTMRAQEIAERFRKVKLPWQVPSLPERRQQIVELLLSGLAVEKKDATCPQSLPARNAAHVVAGGQSTAIHVRKVEGHVSSWPDQKTDAIARVPPRNQLPQRKTPVHMPIFEPHNQAMIIFVTVCADRKKPILAKPEIHDLLKTAWLRADTWMVGRYIIMPDHIHLFCAPARRDYPPLIKWVQYWKTLASKQWPTPADQPVWQKSFWDTKLRRGENYSNKWEYVRQNPVRAGLCGKPEGWAYQGEFNILQWHD